MKDSIKKVNSITEIYAALFGRVDTAITILERMAEPQTFDWPHVAQVTEMLKAALLEAEEQYRNADEEVDNRLIVLPYSTTAPAEDPNRAHPQK